MKPIYWVVIGLVLVIIALILFDKDPEPTDLKPYETAIAIADQKIKQLEEDSAKLARKIKSDSIKQANDRIAYQSEVKKKDAVIAKLEASPEVITVLKENPKVDSLVKALKEKNELQAYRIDTLETNLQTLRVDMGKMNENFSARLRETETKNQALNEQLQIVKQENRKEKRKVKGWKVATVVGTVGAFLLAQ